VNRADKAKLEQAISRDLDGDLSQNEQARLYRQVIRDPEAHDLYDDHKTIDAAAGQALQQALASTRSISDLARTDPDQLIQQLDNREYQPIRRHTRIAAHLLRYAALLALCAGLAGAMWLATRPGSHGTEPAVIVKKDSPAPDNNANSQENAGDDIDIATAAVLSDRQAIIELHLSSQDAMPMFDPSTDDEWIVGEDFYGVIDERDGKFHWFPVQVAGSM